MALDCSVGDQVEVLRKKKLHTAAVLAVLRTGNVDAAYDVDSSVGVLLSAAEHGLGVKDRGGA